MFGFAADTPESDVRPFEPERFVDSQARDGFIARLQRDGSVTDYLLRLRRADRVAIWVEVTAHAETQESGATRVEALVRDVSERKRLEDQARDLYHQLLQAEKLAALGQTISGVAHELNNPLATILTWAERLSQRPVDDLTKRGLETILSESERAAKIVRNLLTFARKRHTTRAMVDVNQIVRETLALRSYEQSLANITIIEALAAGLPLAFADPHQFQQVLLNLIINAEQAMIGANGRGTLILRSWHDLDGDAVFLEVNDDGPGVPEDVQPRIFDPFFTTKEVGKGTGLGPDGRLRDHPGARRPHHGEVGAGQRRVVLRRAAGQRRTGQAGAAEGASNASTSARARWCWWSKMRPRSAPRSPSRWWMPASSSIARATGRKRSRACAARAYDLIICDLKMPRVDGMTFYRALERDHPQAARRILFVTGDVAGTEAERFLGRDRLPLAGEAVQAAGSPADRERDPG